MLYKALLLDLDGTLLDTAADFHVVLNQLLERENKPAISYSSVRKVVSHGARAMVCAGFGITEADPDFARLRHDFLALYGTHYAVNSGLFAGFDSVLAHCDAHGIPWGIITNKPAAFAEPLWRDLALPYSLGCLICPDHVSSAKPDPEPMLLAAKLINTPPEHCLYVGDHRRDIDAGKAANMGTAVANWGYLDESDPANSWQADFYLDTPEQLLSLLTQ
jgi:2-phosphoglycolate phosphatase